MRDTSSACQNLEVHCAAIVPVGIASGWVLWRILH